MGKAFFKLALVVWICALAISIKSYANDGAHANLYQNQMYKNLMKSFLLRGAVDPHHFHYVMIKEFQNQITKTLSLVYVYSEIKSHRAIPEEVATLYPEVTPESVLAEITKALNKASRLSHATNLYYFEDANTVALKMIFVFAQTVKEFAPDMNVRDKKLREVLVNGFGFITENLAGHYFDRARNSAARPYLKPARVGVEEMYKALTPTSVFTRLFTFARPDQRPPSSQNETGKSCRRFFD